MLADLVIELGRSAPTEILPECVLVRTHEMIVWWASARQRTMFFSDSGGESALQKLNAKCYPHPALVFKACGSRLWVRALSENKRPSAKTELCVAPYWNSYDDGSVCTGSMKIPLEKSVSAIDSWEESFFRSEFTHAIGKGKRTEFRGGLPAMWTALCGKKRFPSRHLVETRQTLGSFVANHDKHSRNRPLVD
jgi:PRTRC genetic system protein B